MECCTTTLLICGAIVIGLVLLKKWSQGGRCYSKKRLDGKTVVVTGCNTGIGKETVRDMCKRGANVIMACRNVELANKAADEVRLDTNGTIVVYKLDLADLSSVRECAKEIVQNERRIDILINNAGVMLCPHWKTKEGFEMQFGTNHLGHFLFTNLLLDKIKACAPSRIVTVSSLGHQLFGYGFDIDDLNWEKRSYDSVGAYGASKLANILFSKELARRLEGTNVNTYVLHPGSVRTDLARHLYIPNFIWHTVAWFITKSAEEGAQTSVFCAVDDSVEYQTGLYYSDCAEKTPTDKARDAELAKKLWDISEKLVKL